MSAAMGGMLTAYRSAHSLYIHILLYFSLLWGLNRKFLLILFSFY